MTITTEVPEIATKVGRTGNLDIYEVHEVTLLVRGTAVYKPCNRCLGSGEYSYNSLDGSMCYGCHGRRVGEGFNGWQDALRWAKATKRRRDAAEAKRQARLAAERAAWQEWSAANADLITALGDFNPNRAGFLNSMADLISYERALTPAQTEAVRTALARRAERDAEQRAAGHVGTVGQRLDIEVTVIAVREFEGQWGTRHLVTMRTEQGAVVKTWSTSSFGWTARRELQDAPEGTWPTMRIRGTVKEHGEYQGRPETVLARVAAI